MKLLLKYKEAIVSLGLLPTLFTLVGLLWLPAQPVLFIGAAGSIGGLVYAIVWRRSLNFFLLQGTVSLTACSFIHFSKGGALLPDEGITFTLEFLLLTSAFLYLTLPDSYQHWQQKLHLKCHITYRLEATLIVILSTAHLVSMLIVYSSGMSPDSRTEYVFQRLIPIFIYLLCMAINIIGIRLALREEGIPSSVIRIAPLCKGRIYLTGRHRPTVWDLPIESHFYGPSTAADRKARKLVRRGLLPSPVAPRLLLRHWTTDPASPQRKPVSVYIYPIRQEKDFSATNGRYFTFEEIRQQPAAFSPVLLKELEHLELAAEVWNQYDPLTKN